MPFQFLPQPLFSRPELNRPPRNQDPVVDLRHRLPTHPSPSQVVERPPRLGTFLHLPHIMQTHIPLVPRPPERVRKSSRLVVPLQHQRPLAAVFTQQNRRS